MGINLFLILHCNEKLNTDTVNVNKVNPSNHQGTHVDFG